MRTVHKTQMQENSRTKDIEDFGAMRFMCIFDDQTENDHDRFVLCVCGGDKKHTVQHHFRVWITHRFFFNFFICFNSMHRLQWILIELYMYYIRYDRFIFTWHDQKIVKLWTANIKWQRQRDYVSACANVISSQSPCFILQNTKHNQPMQKTIFVNEKTVINDRWPMMMWQRKIKKLITKRTRVSVRYYCRWHWTININNILWNWIQRNERAF